MLRRDFLKLACLTPLVGLVPKKKEELSKADVDKAWAACSAGATPIVPAFYIQVDEYYRKEIEKLI